MPVNMSNLGAVNAMGKQFTGNIFEKTAGRAIARTKLAGKRALASRHSEAHARATQMPAQPEKTFSPAPPNTKLAEDAVSAGRARRQAKSGYTAPTSSGGSHAAPNFNPTPRQQNMPNNGLNQAPAPKHAAPSFESPSANAKVASHGAPSFSSAPGTQTPRPANMFSSSATNATPTFSHVNTMDRSGSGAPKPSTTPFSTSQPTPAVTPHPVHQTSTAQFHGPQESSRVPLPNLTAAHSTPTAPNTFTHGSNKVSASSQGIGHMGANLEASLASRPFRSRKV